MNGIIQKTASSMPQAADPRQGGGPQEAHEPTFKEAWDRIQAEMGAKPKEQREIKKKLDSNDLMNLMIHQMKLQDPTKPFDMSKMGEEIAQITSVENLKNVGQAIRELSKKDQGLERLAMTNLIGKLVTVDRNQFDHKKGRAEPLAFKLPQKAENVTAEIYSVTGEKVFEKNLGPMNSGQNSFVWNGKEGNTPHLVDDGRYYLRISAVDDKGQPIQTETVVSAKVIGVNYSGEEPEFLIGDAQQQQRIRFSSITKIEDASASSGDQPAFQQAKMDPEKLLRAENHMKAIEEAKKNREENQGEGKGLEVREK